MRHGVGDDYLRGDRPGADGAHAIDWSMYGRRRRQVQHRTRHPSRTHLQGAQPDYEAPGDANRTTSTR